MTVFEKFLVDPQQEDRHWAYLTDCFYFLMEFPHSSPYFGLFAATHTKVTLYCEPFLQVVSFFVLRKLGLFLKLSGFQESGHL